MATFDFRLPDIGEGVVEGEVVKWKVAEGEQIKLDQPMVEVMTDKATVEIPAPRGGRVAKIHVPEGKICQVGQVMISIEESGKAVEPSGNGKAKAAAAAAVPAATAAAVPLAAAVPVAVAATAAVAAANAAPAARVLATPATRRLARELGIDLASVIASGRNNRVTSDDVRRAREAPPARAAAAPAVAPVRIEAGGAEERVPFRGVRKAIAANLARSKQTAAHFTYVEEVDVTDLVALRARAKDKVAERGAKLTYLPFIVKAAVAGLKKWPSLNSSLDETTQEIVLKKYYHLGIATQGPQGLSVGVLRDADKKSIIQISKEIEHLSAAIRDGKATRDELVGGTFTISSLGQLGGVLATPIINFPEAAIMGVHKISERPAVHAGQIVARHLMNLSISVDHRIADGYDGAMFLQEVKTYLEDPTLLFMEMV
ncbi:MAG TPA: dihydrolipoamide acetyltransferase family protein [Haliangiales bacterium]|nr:dihydrolipoamide acetyltransferase family protein [Haliangiales bacterium]